MISERALRSSLRKTIRWYKESGIMSADDGKWGVAERIVLHKENAELKKMQGAYSTKFKKYSIVEQRRADCNMEAAFMFLLMSEVFKERRLYKTACNILEYLYWRSGLLNLFVLETPAAWKWSHINWTPALWFDDNSWMCVLQLIIAERWPDLDKKFDMKKYALELAVSLADGFEKQFAPPEKKEIPWMGNLNKPHWGSLICMALAKAYQYEPDKRFENVIRRYHEYLSENRAIFNTSDQGYALLGAAFAVKRFDDQIYKELMIYFADRLLAEKDPVTGNIPSQHSGEAPAGPHLVDNIYTVNWALLGLHTMTGICRETKYEDAFKDLLSVLLKIQDKTHEKHLYGCWRGMYDMNAGTWGGGDRYEGGANSIYSGWTNAPVPWTIAHYLLGGNLLS